jgi:hypothetical protein
MHVHTLSVYSLNTCWLDLVFGGRGNRLHASLVNLTTSQHRALRMVPVRMGIRPNTAGVLCRQ